MTATPASPCLRVKKGIAVIQSLCTTTYLVLARTLDNAFDRVFRKRGPHTRRDERGQASAEYALVLLGAALLALFLGKWVLENDTMKKVFQSILDKILGGMP